MLAEPPKLSKSKLISLEQGKAKDKNNKRDKGFQDRDLKEEKFPHNRKLSTAGVRGKLQNHRGEHNGGRSESTMEGIHHTEIMATCAIQEVLGCLRLQRLGAGCWLRCRCWTSGRGPGLVSILYELG